MYTPEVEPKEAFDWALIDIINNSPYSHSDTFMALANGQFMVEGRRSDIKMAETYLEYHNGEPDVFKASDDWYGPALEPTVY